jgi:hypothetical protein
MTGDSSEFLKAQMVVQRFRPRYFGDLGAAAYAAFQTVPLSGNSYASPFPVSYVTARPVGDVIPASVIRDAVPCRFDGAPESHLFRNKSDPAVLSVRDTDAAFYLRLPPTRESSWGRQPFARSHAKAAPPKRSRCSR